MSYNKRKNEAYAKELRKNMTRHESHLWYDFLSKYPVHFQRQKPIGSYVADFYCRQARLVIEIDGDTHDGEDARIYDAARTDFLAGCGLYVLRLRNNAVQYRFSEVCELIEKTVKERINK